MKSLNRHVFNRLFSLLLILGAFQPRAQDFSIVNGIVVDTNEEPLPGATVQVKGTSRGAITDISGDYSLELQSEDEVLVISYVGFITQEVKVADRSKINITLKQDLEALEEVVVVGYGTAKKDDLTGSVAVIKSEEFNKGAVNSPQELIQGKFAGVTVNTNSGAPGNSSTIRIRGVSSILASNDPLIVIDDVPLNNKSTGGAPNLLSLLNPNDIESFTVLKDASATAIYGSRAAGGVILITTKRGSKEKISVDYSLTSSYYTIPQSVDVFSAEDFTTLIEQQYPADHDARNHLGDADTHWQSQIFRNALGQDHNLSLSGSTKDLKYRASLGYNSTEGTLETYYFERTTAAIGLDPSLLNDRLKIQFNAKGMLNSNNFADQGAIGNAIAYNPTLPIFNGNSRYYGYTTLTDNPENPNANPLSLAPANPVAQLALTDNTSEVVRLIGNLKLNYELLDGLVATANLGYDYTTSEGHNNVDDSTQWIYLPVSEGGQTTKYKNERKNALIDAYLSYRKDWEGLGNLEFMLGHSWAHFHTYDYDSTWSFDQTVFQRGQENPTEHYLLSFFGRVNYSLGNKYLFTLTLRNDLTSRFSPETRSGWFPSAAVAWNIKDEAFLSSSSFLYDLKLRIGYGITGQQDVVSNDYPYIPTYTISNNSARYQLGSTFYHTLRPDGYDEFLKWETTSTVNVGLDFGFTKNKVSGSLDLYFKETIDLLNQVDVSPGTNFTAELITNVGDMVNRGVELNLNYRAITLRDWDWKLNANVFYNRNEVTRLNRGNDPEYTVEEPAGAVGGTTDGSIQIYRVGYPVRSYYVYQQVYDANGDMIPNALVDRNKNGIIDTGDRYIFNDPAPDITIGLNSWLTFKQLEFVINTRVQLNNYVYNNIAATSSYNDLYSGMGFLRNMSTEAGESMQRFSDHFVEDASFLRIDNINVSYGLTNVFNGLMDLRLTLGVQNALVFTRYNGLDPEINGGMDNNFYPRSRVFMLGLNANF